jgi:uncharacterized protein (DUF433 family)
MNVERSYVRTDEHGVMRVAGTRVTLDSVYAAFERGHSPETIAQQYPTLKLEEVYGAITYILAHRQEVDGYIARQNAIWTEARRVYGSDDAPVVQRLRALARKTEAPAG